MYDRGPGSPTPTVCRWCQANPTLVLTAGDTVLQQILSAKSDVGQRRVALQGGKSERLNNDDALLLCFVGFLGVEVKSRAIGHCPQEDTDSNRYQHLRKRKATWPFIPRTSPYYNDRPCLDVQQYRQAHSLPSRGSPSDMGTSQQINKKIVVNVT